MTNDPKQSKEKCGATVLIDGESIWKEWLERDYKSDDFSEIGKSYEESVGAHSQKVGHAESSLFQVKEMVDFAVGWMKSNRSFE